MNAKSAVKGKKFTGIHKRVPLKIPRRAKPIITPPDSVTTPGPIPTNSEPSAPGPGRGSSPGAGAGSGAGPGPGAGATPLPYQALLDTRDLYELLGVDRKATLAQITKSYKKLAVIWHPDKNPQNIEEATRVFQKVSAAHKILSDPEKRRIYDVEGELGLKEVARKEGYGADDEWEGEEDFDIFDLFSGMGFMSNNLRKCKPIIQELPISLTNLYTGKKYRINLRVKRECVDCEGTGSSEKKIYTCSFCKGRGYMQKVIEQGTLVQRHRQKCSNCAGRGGSIDPKETCPACKGNEWLFQKICQEFEVKPGFEWGNRMVIAGEGNRLRDHAPGDILIKLTPAKDYKEGSFIRIGADLIYRFQITLAEALLGMDRVVEHLDKRKLRVKIDGPVNPNSKKIILEEGMPIITKQQIYENMKWEDYERGNLIIAFAIIFPDELDSYQRACFELGFRGKSTALPTDDSTGAPDHLEDLRYKDPEYNSGERSGLEPALVQDIQPHMMRQPNIPGIDVSDDEEFSDDVFLDGPDSDGEDTVQKHGFLQG